jgi:hypothetical protein
MHLISRGSNQRLMHLGTEFIRAIVGVKKAVVWLPDACMG